jgi:LppX_LprAFG lipoprotein
VIQRRSWATLVVAGFLLILAGCGGNQAASPTPLPEPKALLDVAAQTIQNARSVRFKLQLTGAPAFIDLNNLISFVSADGAYVSPDKVTGKVSAAVAGISGTIDIVAIGDDQYYKHTILTGNQWLKDAFSPGFNADRLIRGDQGIRKAIDSLKNLQYVGTQDLFGVQVHHIQGTAAVADIQAVTVGLIRGTGEATVDVYLNVETGNLERMTLLQAETATKENPEPTLWTMEFFDYDKPDIVIEVPQQVQIPATPGLLGVPGAPSTTPAETPQP